MKTLLCLVTIACALGSPFACEAAQNCLSESEIPSSTPTNRFRDNGDGTVTDKGTGLMWAKCAVGLSGPNCGSGSSRPFPEYTWQDALDLAAGSNLAGFRDWRLPNVKELLSIIEQRCINPSINQAASLFPNTPAWDFWSASPSVGPVGRFDHAWSVSFYEGRSRQDNIRNHLMHVRLVRSGN